MSDARRWRQRYRPRLPPERQFRAGPCARLPSAILPAVRSVLVFTDASAEVLNELLPVDETQANRVVQEVTIEDPPNWSDGWVNPHLLRQLTLRFGRLPKRLVIVDISGKVDGQREALEVAEAIRVLGTAAVLDDWSESPWSDEELGRGQSLSGRRFLSPPE